jgi:hypothetical protein
VVSNSGGPMFDNRSSCLCAEKQKPEGGGSLSLKAGRSFRNFRQWTLVQNWSALALARWRANEYH